MIGGYQLDHMISTNHRFIHGISPEIIGNIHNLRIVPWAENNKKRCKSSFTIDELVQRINSNNI
jgi:hypothetical protein